MNLKESLVISKKEIDWKSLIFGSAFCTVLAMIGSEPGLWFLISVSAIGLLYIGYEAKNIVWGAILGAIGTIPLFIVAMYGGLGEIVSTNYSIELLAIFIFIFCIAIGALVGAVGALAKKNRQKAIKMREKELSKKGKKNKKKK